MKYKNKLVEKIETFYVDAVDEFKEAELQIIADSRFSNMFKKKDYDGNIKRLRLCKNAAMSLGVEDSDADKDEGNTEEVIKRFERCLVLFNRVCDAYIKLQMSLKGKAEKKSLKYSEYKEMYDKVKDSKEDLNNALHDLDIVYTDYAYDDDDDNTGLYQYL